MFEKNKKFIVAILGFNFLAALIFVKPALALSNLTDPFSEVEPSASGLSYIAGSVIKGFLSIAGSLALVMIVYAGFKWMTARGNAEQAKKSQEIMLWTALGVAVIFGSYIILSFIIRAIK